MKDGSLVRQKTDKMNNTDRVNYILRNSAFMLASSMVASDDTRRKQDDKKEKKILKKLEKKQKKLEQKKTKYDKLKSARDAIKEEMKTASPKKKASLETRLKKQLDKSSLAHLKVDIKKLEKAIKRYNRKLEEISERRKQGYVRVFGGRKAFEQRSKNQITHEEFKQKRLLPLYVVGDKQNGNRMFEFVSETRLLYKHDKDSRIYFDIDKKRLSSKDRNIIKRLMQLKADNKIAMTFQFGDGFVCVTYDIDDLLAADRKQYTYVKNRFLGIDSGPNELGVSVVEWTGPHDYKLLYYDVFSIKELNEKWFELNEQKNVANDDPRRIYNHNCRITDLSKVCSEIASLAAHWHVEGICVEDLNVEQEDTEKGSKFNTLVNNLWPHAKIDSWLERQCDERNIRYIRVNPKYSSVAGNLLFRSNENVPDMCLAAIEMTRRGYEVLHQYIRKDKTKRKNIVFPDGELYSEELKQSTEEIFGNDNLQAQEVKVLFPYIVKAGTMYRRRLDSCNLSFRKLNSHHSRVRTVFYNTGCGKSTIDK